MQRFAATIPSGRLPEFNTRAAFLAAFFFARGLISVKPVLQALVIAEHVYEAKDGKKVIAGTFNQVTFGRIAAKEIEQPGGTKRRLLAGGAHSGAPYAYISLTDVCDGTELTLQFVNLSTNKVQFETRVALKCEERLATIEIVAPLPRLSITEAGVYAFEVLCEGELIGSHRIIAKELNVGGFAT